MLRIPQFENDAIRTLIDDVGVGVGSCDDIVVIVTDTESFQRTSGTDTTDESTIQVAIAFSDGDDSLADIVADSFTDAHADESLSLANEYPVTRAYTTDILTDIATHRSTRCRRSSNVGSYLHVRRGCAVRSVCRVLRRLI